MVASNKKVDFKHSARQPSEGDFVNVNQEQVNDQTKKPKYNRKLLLLLLFMFLIVSQVIVLLALNNGFINRSPEPVVDNKQTITLDDLQKVNVDLNKVRKSLDEINSNTALKDDPVETKKIENKPAAVQPAPVLKKPTVIKPVVLKKNKIKVTAKQKIAESKKALQIKKSPVVVIPQPLSKPVAQEITSIDTNPVYIKHDINGKSLVDNNEQWSCVSDTKSGLMWEVKSKDDTMRNSNNLYSWFNPNNKTLKGVTGGGRCKGDTGCDTHAYVNAMNKQNFCGHDDWRLPTREEMMGLVSFVGGAGNIKINTSYFPGTLPSWYWTASSNESRPEFAWYVLFKNGVPLNDLKENPKHVRLVRSESSLASN